MSCCFFRSFSLEFTAKWGCQCWCMTWVSFALANLEENPTWQQLLILLSRVVCWFCQLWDLLWSTRSWSFCWIWQSHGKNPCCKLDLWAELLIGNAGSFGACSPVFEGCCKLNAWLSYCCCQPWFLFVSPCCLSSLFSAMFFFLFANLQSSLVLAWMLFTTQASSRDK